MNLFPVCFMSFLIAYLTLFLHHSLLTTFLFNSLTLVQCTYSLYSFIFNVYGIKYVHLYSVHIPYLTLTVSLLYFLFSYFNPLQSECHQQFTTGKCYYTTQRGSDGDCTWSPRGQPNLIPIIPYPHNGICHTSYSHSHIPA